MTVAISEQCSHSCFSAVFVSTCTYLFYSKDLQGGKCIFLAITMVMILFKTAPALCKRLTAPKQKEFDWCITKKQQISLTSSIWFSQMGRRLHPGSVRLSAGGSIASVKLWCRALGLSVLYEELKKEKEKGLRLWRKEVHTGMAHHAHTLFTQTAGSLKKDVI